MADRDSWGDSPSNEPAPVVKKKMSGCLLATLIVGGIGIVGALVCCGVGGWIFSKFAPVVTHEPAEITEAARKILDIKPPTGFSPNVATTMDNPIFTMRMAEFKQKDGKGELLMITLKMNMGDPKQADIQLAQFRKPFEERNRDSLNIKGSETREVMINNEKTTVTISEGTDRSTLKAVHLVEGDINIPMGKTIFSLRMDDDIWDEDEILQMLESTSSNAPADADEPADETKTDDKKPADAKPEEDKTP